jgi:hypothetical protein
MSDSSGLKLDGLPLEQPALASHGLTVPHRIFQPNELTLAGVFMPATREDRGWPEPREATRIDQIQAPAILRLRSIISDVLVLASRAPSRFSRESVVSGMQQSLLGPSICLSDRAGRTIGTCCHRQACQDLPPGRRLHPIQREGLALQRRRGGSGRRDHSNASQRDGRSARHELAEIHDPQPAAALLRSHPEGLVKTIAFDHGFWHLGRFSRTYRAFFGE